MDNIVLIGKHVVTLVVHIHSLGSTGASCECATVNFET